MVSELHLHLDGSMRIKTLIDLAKHEGIKLGSYEPDELLEQIKFKKGMTQDEGLKRFATTLSVMQTPYAISRIAYEICEDNKQRGIDYIEARYCPFLHLQGKMHLEEVVKAVHRGLSMGEKDFNIRTAQIFAALRHEPATGSTLLAKAACNLAEKHPEYNIAGFDLCCAEANNPPWEHWEAYEIIRKAGLKATVHAGEVEGSMDYLRYIIYEMDAQRIGHGTILIQDEKLTGKAAEKGITVECCVTSNVHTGIIKSAEEHPAKRLFDAGVKIAFCADNTLLSQTYASRELSIAKRRLGFSEEDIEKCVRYSDEARFRK